MFTYTIDSKTHLKLLERRDAKELFELIHNNRPHLREWMPWVAGTTELEHTESFIQSTLDKFAKSNGFDAGIWHNGTLAGTVGFHEINTLHGFTSIGYWLGKEFEGRGLMTQAVEALVEYAFHTLGLHRVEIRCASLNLKSQAIPKRLGFTEEGQVREAEWLYDHHVDHIIYGMLQREWKK